MSPQNESLSQVEMTAIEALRGIDLETPTRQLRQALEALLDVPTIARRGDTAVSRQAAAALAKLRQDVQRLHEAVQILGNHVERPPSRWRPNLSRCFTSMAGEGTPVTCAPLPYSEMARQA